MLLEGTPRSADLPRLRKDLLKVSKRPRVYSPEELVLNAPLIVSVCKGVMVAYISRSRCIIVWRYMGRFGLAVALKSGES